jgi:ABC-type phosphate transport system auxiliary subunit
MNKPNKKPQEFSKKILTQTKWLFVLQVILVIVFACLEYDTTALCITATVSGGVYGASIIFYLNKAKTENISKGRLKLAIFKTQLTTKANEGEISEEDMSMLNEEIDRLDEQYNASLDNKLDEALNEEITIQNY